MVASPPTFEAKTSGNSKISGSISRARAIRMVIGAISNIVVTLSRNADETAVKTIKMTINLPRRPPEVL